MSRALYSSLLIALFLMSFASAAGFKEASNAALDKQVGGEFGKLTQSLFKLQDVDMSKAIIIYVIFIVVLLIIVDAASFIPFLENKILSFIVALIVSLLISLSGAYADATEFLSNSAANFTAGWQIVALIIVILIFLGLFIILKELMHYIKLGNERSKSYWSGFMMKKESVLNSILRKSKGYD